METSRTVALEGAGADRLSAAGSGAGTLAKPTPTSWRATDGVGETRAAEAAVSDREVRASAEAGVEAAGPEAAAVALCDRKVASARPARCFRNSAAVSSMASVLHSS